MRHVRLPDAVVEPYVLITPTYNGAVPKPVITFLNNHENRRLLRGVISAGNTNFGADFGAAGRIISTKCHVPHLHAFELTGTREDLDRVRDLVTSVCLNPSQSTS